MRGRSRFVGAGSRRNHASGVGAELGAIATSAPDGWWRSDGVVLSGPDVTSITDRSGNGHTLVAVNPAALGTGGQGGRDFLDFVAASSEHYQVADGTALDFDSGDATTLHLVSPDAGLGHIMSKWAGVDGWFNFLNSTPLFQARSDGVTAAITDSETASLAAFQAFRGAHLAGTSVTAFVNGTGTATSGNSGAVSNTDKLTLGGRSDASSTFFDGKWYESIIWLRALTAQEITDITAEVNTYYATAFGSI